MNIEIIEYYPIEIDQETHFVSGTIRVRLPDHGISILGVYASRKNGRWFFNLPSRITIDHLSGKKVRYPTIAFENQEKQKELIEAIREKAPSFIERRLSDKENPLVLPQKIKEDSIKPLPPEEKENSAQSELKSMPNTQKRTWTTPPPIKRIKTAAGRRK